jgi:hypothetical protein
LLFTAQRTATETPTLGYELTAEPSDFLLAVELDGVDEEDDSRQTE